MESESKTLRRSDLVDMVAEAAGIKKSEADKAVTETFNAIIKALRDDNAKITLTGFGTFDVADQAAREGRNPATGATIQIPARKKVRFKLGSELDAIR